MESRDGKCDPFDGVYSRVSFNLLRLETNALLSGGCLCQVSLTARCVLLLTISLTKYLQIGHTRAAP